VDKIAFATSFSLSCQEVTYGVIKRGNCCQWQICLCNFMTTQCSKLKQASKAMSFLKLVNKCQNSATNDSLLLLPHQAHHERQFSHHCSRQFSASKNVLFIGSSFHIIAMSGVALSFRGCIVMDSNRTALCHLLLLLSQKQIIDSATLKYICCMLHAFSHAVLVRLRALFV
jgi:hypothetical protein